MGIALNPGITLWGLTELKMEILAQVAPLFILGASWNALTTRAALAGMCAGATVYAGLLASGHAEPWNLHAGVVALIVNVTVCGADTARAGHTGSHACTAGGGRLSRP